MKIKSMGAAVLMSGKGKREGSVSRDIFNMQYAVELKQKIIHKLKNVPKPQL